MRAVQKQVALMQRSGHVCQLSELFLVRRERSSARLEQLTSRVRSDSKGTITDIAYHRLHTLEKFVVEHSTFAPGGDWSVSMDTDFMWHVRRSIG